MSKYRESLANEADFEKKIYIYKVKSEAGDAYKKVCTHNQKIKKVLKFFQNITKKRKQFSASFLQLVVSRASGKRSLLIYCCC